MQKADTLIIGGGPAGLFTALHCKNQSVVVLEKKGNPGNKLLIAGSGRCNLTHDGYMDDFFRHYGPNHRFLKPALLRFTNDDLIDFFQSRGLDFVTDENGKVFPVSQKSKDILKVLLYECEVKGVKIQIRQEVLKIEKKEQFFYVSTQDQEYCAHNLVIATGGKSYPGTGSTGDGYHFAEAMGHIVNVPKPALTPVFVKNYNMVDCAGVSLQNVKIFLYRDGKKINEHRGDILFTHNGLSGPGILDFSRYMEKGDVLKINVIGLNAEVFTKSFLQAVEKEGKKSVQTFFKLYDIPKSVIRCMLDGLRMDTEEKLANINKFIRNQLISAFCECPFEIEQKGGFDVAMVIAGGVKTDEINPKTMESRKITGLYFAGEVIDIDGDTGGYNLQAAFSTGFLTAFSLNSKYSILVAKE